MPDLLVMNKEFYQKLPEDLRAIVDQVAKETQIKQRELWQKNENEIIETLKKEGMIFNEVDDPLAFSSRVDSLYEEYYKKHGAEFKKLCEEIKSQK